ncbi:hypothetical protein [Avibacterium sp. 21-599]|uniref:hypothetical protein n=1 Tax=Avibacterium sp. 21-599 TaxID=2911528 RepID=UPI002246DAFB|nr:hypothetical protein [Avibacterium sp. 21-599]MCW9717661.1 hypothetical protein [Avibacterium sp. 21-599]
MNERISFTKLLNSSILFGFLVLVGWSVAYCYNWGLAWYYGYPWDIVEVGRADIARSLFHVLGVSAFMLLTYILGIRLLILLKDKLSSSPFNFVRTLLTCFILTFPLFLEITVLIKVFTLYSLLIYITGLLVISLLLCRFFTRYNICMLWQSLAKKQLNIVPTAVVIYFYFVILACLVGYLRPFNKDMYHKLEINAEQYFILAKNCNSLILGKSYEKGGKDFYLMPCHYGSKGSICHIVAGIAEK